MALRTSLSYLTTTERCPTASRVQLLDPEHRQCARPVDGLGDRGRLAQLQLAQPADDVDQLLGQRLREPGVLAADDLQLALGRGVVEEQVQAAPLEGGGEVAGVVAGQDHVRRVLGGERCRSRVRTPGTPPASPAAPPPAPRPRGRPRRSAAPTGRRSGSPPATGEAARNRSEKNTLSCAPIRSTAVLQVGGVGDDLADLLPQDLGVQQLLAVVPLVQGLGLVLALVALQPQQPPPGGRRQRLGQLRLADAAGPSTSNGLSSLVSRKTVVARRSSAM